MCCFERGNSDDETNVSADLCRDSEPTLTSLASSIFLFNVEERSDVTLDLLHQFNYQPECIIQAISLGPRVIVIVGRNPNANYPIIALDVHTRIQLLLPSFINATGETSEVCFIFLTHYMLPN